MTMLGRLLVGIVKGLILGSLLGFGLVKLGQDTPGAILAYPAAALTGVLVGLVAGKPIWAKDAKIEAGMKAVVGALLSIGLMAAARTWLANVPLPFSVGALAPASAHPMLGTFAMSALAAIAGLLGGFYEADNDPSSEEAAPSGQKAQQSGQGRRIAPALKSQGEDEDEVEDEADRKRSKK
jgi:hypothetical protein